MACANFGFQQLGKHILPALFAVLVIFVARFGFCDEPAEALKALESKRAGIADEVEKVAGNMEKLTTARQQAALALSQLAAQETAFKGRFLSISSDLSLETKKRPPNPLLVRAYQAELAKIQVQLTQNNNAQRQLQTTIVAHNRQIARALPDVQRKKLQLYEVYSQWLKTADPFGQLARGKADEAEDLLSQVIEWDRDYAPAFAARALVRLQAGDQKAAIADFDEALTRGAPQKTAIIALKSLALDLLGDHESAEAQWQLAQQLDKKSPVLFLCRGIAESRGLNARKKPIFANALRDFQMAMRLDKQQALAYREIAWLRAACPDRSIRNPGEAVEMAKEAVRLTNERDWVSLATAARALAEDNQFNEAELHADRANAICPQETQQKLDRQLQLYGLADTLRLFEVAKPSPPKRRR